MQHGHTSQHEHEGALPIMSAYNETIATVMDRHGISQAELAARSQLSKPVISRIVNGTRVVSPEVVRGLWELTLDTQIIAMLTGMGSFALLRCGNSSLTKSQAECLMVRACSQVMSEYATSPTTDDQRAERAQLIDEAINSLLIVREKLYANPQATNAASAYRAVQHPQSHKPTLDAVA